VSATKKSRKITTVLFDLDGTLIDTAPDMAAALDVLCDEEQRSRLPFSEVRPVVSNGSVALVTLACMLAAPLLVTYLETGLVPRLPTAILATGLVMTASISAVCGLILDSLARARTEAKRAVFLSYPAQDWTR